MSFELYNILTSYGDQFAFNIKVNTKKILSELTQFDNDWAQYNPRKPVNRYGLSLTNYDGKLGPGPDLDSLDEYNIEHNVDISEKDFKVCTPAYDLFKEHFEPFKEWLFRSHIIKLGPGGFFPQHIDNYGMTIPSFRIIVPLKNCNPMNGYFLLEDRILNWEYGRLYFMNTCKRHTVFNSSMKDMLFVVLNVELTGKSLHYFLGSDMIL